MERENISSSSWPKVHFIVLSLDRAFPLICLQSNSYCDLSQIKEKGKKLNRFMMMELTAMQTLISSARLTNEVGAQIIGLVASSLLIHGEIAR